ncbi:MAG: response regulator, partial [Vicinamibacterales bacterium]|nr:response regulator [Vicinamibacterales bacterium]
ALAEYEVDTAADATSALDRMRTGAYDLMIADLKMPGMDGLTLIRQAKRIKADMPVIIITGFSTESSAIEAVNLGVAGYLTKPCRVPQVLAAAAKALGAPAA